MVSPEPLSPEPHASMVSPEPHARSSSGRGYKGEMRPAETGHMMGGVSPRKRITPNMHALIQLGKPAELWQAGYQRSAQL